MGRRKLVEEQVWIRKSDSDEWAAEDRRRREGESDETSDRLVKVRRGVRCGGGGGEERGEGGGGSGRMSRKEEEEEMDRKRKGAKREIERNRTSSRWRAATEDLRPDSQGESRVEETGSFCVYCRKAGREERETGGDEEELSKLRAAFNRPRQCKPNILSERGWCKTWVFSIGQEDRETCNEIKQHLESPPLIKLMVKGKG
ncbi:hypothetical protein BY996DRAFT_6514738 [Phakopsora pachyrhizi]|nr:hypothetical protein BY996DRAFT_6514738 [Phakopsora pachyrhizi]